MKKLALATAAVLAASAVLAAPAHADDYCDFEDDVRPTYISSSISPSSVVIGKVKRSVKITVRAADDCGVEGIAVTLNPKGNVSAGMIFAYEFTLVSGTAKNGTWQATEVLSDYERGGLWTPGEIEIDDANFNSTTRLNAAGSLQIRHATATTLSKPAAKVKKGKKVTLKGSIEVSGMVDETVRLQVQRRIGKKKWKNAKNITSDFLGGYSTKLKVTKTASYRVVHATTSATVGSASKAYKVKKK